MKVPELIEVYGQWYEIEMVDDLTVHEGANGAHFGTLSLIQIDSSLEDDELEVTILHELIHAVLYRTGINEGLEGQLEEAVCESIAKFMVETFEIEFKK